MLLQEVMNDLPASERKVAQFILNNPRHFVGLSITELAEQSGTSAAGVVRLCKRLRMSGFRELKLRITMDVSHSIESQRSVKITPGASLDDITRALVHNNEVLLHDILKTLDMSAVRAAIDAVASARRVDIYGSGASSIVALDLNMKLLKLGLCTSSYQDGYTQVTSAGTLDKRDLAISISYSGEDANVLAATRQAIKSEARTVSVTRFSSNTLADLCETNLFVPSGEPILEDGVVISHIALMIVGDLLFAGLASLDSRDFLGYLERSQHALERLHL